MLCCGPIHRGVALKGDLGLRRDARRPARGAQRQRRQGRLGAEDRRMEERRHDEPGAARRQGPRDHRRLGRRVRRARLSEILQCQDRRAGMDDLHRPGPGRAGQRDLAQGRQLEDRRRPDLADRPPTTPTPTRSTGAPAIPAPGAPTCARATISGRFASWRSTRTPARSSGAISTRRTTPGTMTAQRRRSSSTPTIDGKPTKALVQSQPQRLLLRARPHQRALPLCLADGRGHQLDERPRSRRPASPRSTRR